MRAFSVEDSGPRCHVITIIWHHSLLYPGVKAESKQPARLRIIVLVVVAHAIRQEKVLHKLLKERKQGWEITYFFFYVITTPKVDAYAK